jgi:hypothetical protein
MSDYLERLERELLAAGRRAQTERHRPTRPGSRPLSRLPAAAAAVLSIAVTIAVVVVIVGIGGSRGAPRQASRTGSHLRHPIGMVQPIVSRDHACRLVHNAYGHPPVVDTNAVPAPGLRSILALARNPGNASGLASLGRFDPDSAGDGVLAVYGEHIRIMSGAEGTKLAFFPAVVCNETVTPSANQLHPRVRIAAVQAIVMLVLSNPPLHPAVLAGTASTILNGPAEPGLDLPDQRGYIQAIVVPDGVARVVMHFTPPFLHHYSATATIQDNIGIVVRKAGDTPTTVEWYAANGHLIRTFVDRQAIREDNCLAKHEKNCA